MEVRIILHCSVIILISCFIENSRSDSNRNRNRRTLTDEVEYEHYAMDKLYSKRTGYRGDSLIVGTKISKVHGEERVLRDQSTPNQYTCRQEPDSFFSESKHDFLDITILKRSSESFNVEDGETTEPVKVSDHFAYIQREVWHCWLEEHGHIDFYRIVNHLISFEEIRDIKYHEGVEVSAVDYDGNGWKTKIKETRYMAQYDPNGPFEALKYYGYLILEFMEQTSDDSIPNWDRHIEHHPGGYDADFKEIEFREGGERQAVVASDGISLKIGSSWTKDRTLPAMTGFKCGRVLGMHPLPDRFLPEIYQTIVDPEKPEEKIYGRIVEPALSKLFTLVISTVWHCKSDNAENNDLEFYRVMNEVIGRCQVKDVTYEDDIVGLSSIKTEHGKSIRFTQVGLFDIRTGNRLNREVIYTVNRLGARKSTLPTHPVSIDLSYTLTPSAVYKTLINSEGYDVRVGSKVTSTIGSDTAKCRKLTLQEQRKHNSIVFDTKFKIKVDGGVWKTMESIQVDSENRYFKPLQTDIWLCTSTNTDNQFSFYRIINKIEINVQVRTIETFDGIHILQSPTQNGAVGVEIVELKYINSRHTKSNVMFAGIITFEANEGTSFNIDPHAVKNSLEETVHCLMVGQHTNHPLKDLDSGSNQNELIISGKQNKMQFPVGSAVIGSNEDIVECKLYREDNQYYPDFKAVDGTGHVIRSMNNFVDSATYMKYFEMYNHELWLCEYSGQNPYKFLRAVTKHTLKKDIDIGIGKLEYTKRDEAWIEMKDDMTAYTVKLDQIRYLDHNKPTTETVNYDGYLALEEPEDKLQEEQWMSGSVKFSEFQNLRQRVRTEKEYIPLDQKNVASHHVPSGNGETWRRNEVIVIGSLWEHKLEGTHTFQCDGETVVDQSNIPEKYRTEIQITGQKTGTSNPVPNYIRFIKTLSRMCRNSEVGKRFIRVVNHLSTIGNALNYTAELQYYDGVTILKRDGMKRQEFEIVEVKYLEPDTYRVLKFLGKLNLETGTNEEAKIFTNDVHKKSNEYIALPSSRIRKTSVSGTGNVFEIGDQFLMRAPRNYMSCQETDASKASEGVKKVKVVLADWKESGNMERKELGKSDVKEYFDIIETRVWDCTDGMQNNYWRIQNKLKLKSGKNLQTVYHHAGVFVNVRDQEVEIEETKYINKIGNKVVEFDGMVTLTPRGGTARDSSTGIRDFKYNLDNEVIYFQHLYPSPGDILDINPEFQGTIQLGGRVSCRENKGLVFKPEWSTQIKRLETRDYTWKPITDQDYFQRVENEIWECRKETDMEKIAFYRIVEKCILSNKPSVIYYHSSLTQINRQITIVQIVGVKFLESIEDTQFKNFAGKLELLSSDDVVLKRLFPINEPSIAGVATRQQKYPMNILMLKMLAKHESGDSSRKEPLTDDKVGSQQNQFKTELVKNGLRVVQIGTLWEEELPYNGEMKCTSDSLTKTFGLRYLPRLVELIDDKAYLLGDDDFLEMFHVNKVEVWICTNKVDTIIRVVTQFKVRAPKLPLFAIRYSDTVELKLSDTSASNSDTTSKEIIYINAKNGKVVKYNGEISLLTPGPPSTNGRGPNMSGGASNRPGGHHQSGARSFLSRAFGGCFGGGCSTLNN